MLGDAVKKHLCELGVENNTQQAVDKQMVIAGIANLMRGLGLDLNNAQDHDPSRIADFMVNDLFSGLDYANFPKITLFPNTYKYHSPLYSKHIGFRSTCEHHFVAITGEACVAYIPGEHIVGLSKLSRVVDFFARRPQVQERATLQIFHALQYVLETDDVAVAINAQHHCVTLRGVNDHNVSNLTYQCGGQFNSDLILKQEFTRNAECVSASNN